MNWKLLTLGLRVFKFLAWAEASIKAWRGFHKGEAIGEQKQRDADLAAQNTILKKREAVPHPTGNPFDDGKF